MKTEYFSLPLLARIAEDIQLEAKFLFPDNTEKQLRWCAAKGCLMFATKMAHYLRTVKDEQGNLVFPNISDTDGNAAQKNAHNDQQKCARNLYDSQTQLLNGFNKYEKLLTAYYSTHEMIKWLQEIWPKPDGVDEDILQMPKGIEPPDRQTVLVRPLNMDYFPVIIHDGKKMYHNLRADILRVGNFVDVPHGNEYKTVRINGITRRKIGYATTSGAGEKYARMHDVKPVRITGEKLTSLLSFKLVDEYSYDGKNYYDNVYQEKILDDKGDLTQWGLFGMKMVSVHKFELFPEKGLRATLFIISNIEKPDDCYAKLETMTMTGNTVNIFYPVFIHEVQNFIDFLVSIKDSHTKVYLERKQYLQTSNFK